MNAFQNKVIQTVVHYSKQDVGVKANKFTRKVQNEKNDQPVFWP